MSAPDRRTNRHFHTPPDLTVRPRAAVRRGLPLALLGFLVALGGSVAVGWRAGRMAPGPHSLVSGPWQVGVGAACLLGALLVVVGTGYLSSFVTITHDRIVWRWHFVRSEVALADVVGVTLAPPRSASMVWLGSPRSWVVSTPGSMLHLVHRKRGMIRVDPVTVRRNALTRVDAALVCRALERAIAAEAGGIARRPPSNVAWPGAVSLLRSRISDAPSSRWVPPMRSRHPARSLERERNAARSLGPFEPQIPSIWN